MRNFHIISQVLPHEISVANKEHYTQLYAEMYGWEWDEEEEDDDDVGAPPEFDAANVVSTSYKHYLMRAP